ncbi:DUF1292 domain-containing protein [Caldibacillus lycopersici]|uniref:DUF1292 domain-containing protein n=1 Tax=Perspicuibacillus lycopersici TaxID=1325689 RepID=A0AAE3LRJ2_9BACI|nr:DUF1292 domain-containing protein [Perspicuibacillus lycopersici]MCU9614724.1 DUF1292 domain-containing protein [Perspicuibacillus lycopersici]
MDQVYRNSITVKDNNGEEKTYIVEAMFELNGEEYALIQHEEAMALMKMEQQDGQQYLVGVENPDTREFILDAYQIAVEANPAD